MRLSSAFRWSPGLALFVLVLARPAGSSTIISYVVEPIVLASLTADFGVRLDINNSGEVVWQQGIENTDGYWRKEIFSSRLGRITSNAVEDVDPLINDLGQIGWTSEFLGLGGLSWEVVIDGTRITFDDTSDGSLEGLNNSSEAVWGRRLGDGIGGIVSSVRGLVASGSVGAPDINNLGEIVYEYEANAELISTTRGVIGNGFRPTINDLGEVVWTSTELELVSSERGLLALSGFLPDINNHGDVAFIDGEGRLVVLHDGTEVMIDDGIRVIGWPAINDAGVVAFIGDSTLGRGVFVATPVPEPSVAVLCGAAMVVVTWMIRGRSGGCFDRLGRDLFVRASPQGDEAS